MLLKNSWQKWMGLFITILLLLFLLCSSIVYGYTDTTWKLAIDAFTNFNGTNEHIVIQSVRLPRALIASAIGASLAISGVLMQTLTKNPLASPDIFGVNAGAGLAVVTGVTVFGISNLQVFTWLSFLGAAIAAISIFMIGSMGRGGLTPMKLTLAGAAMTAMVASLTQGLLVSNEALLEQVLFWLAGSVSGRSLDNLVAVLPYLAVGWGLALIMSGKMNVLSMGEDVAKGLGLNIVFLKLVLGLAIILLSGGSVAVAGPIGFIGIVVPHLTRSIVGIDHRWLIPFSGLFGAVLLIAADVISRYILMPREVPVGVMTAIIGTPFFIYIARKGFSGR
ncbi:FecCD family ABC transporter permease [Peribacillus frigoritolerans]|jgi:iron complex transport system permease protein|uniref:FecCD family ABC transporter permease n=1 Tax=Peribacillus frigoritolerans TaxID=450367 RepID=UPI0006AC0124|nr:iron ABC transporter permease [Peribacillus frigoritolerans]KOR81024.1 iron ABC transporter [Bacillus sp. FJAT-21352]AZV62150.1 iron ABC transporter permease [Peribacillus frigoritolerans]MCY9138687.1 iron ABC transporter permease [Peribacillus frigoritolerans]MDM5308946.1 iron ABC transporter permease [Peribacillus frigoritolerans]MED4687730.1 iron ABC transporter permease [Peribacillus frigoritolerans]